jgi:hypothetical protein
MEYSCGSCSVTAGDIRLGEKSDSSELGSAAEDMSTCIEFWIRFTKGDWDRGTQDRVEVKRVQQ